MAAGARRDAGHAWLATLLGILVLVAGGFALGLVVGVISQEPELVVGHVAGRSTKIAWSAAQPASTPTTIAPPAPTPRPAPEPTSEPVSVPVSRSVSAPPPPEAALPEAAPRARYAVQVGAFAGRSAAGKVLEGLRGRGYPAYLVESSDDGRFRVRVGPVPERAEADRMAHQLKVEEKLPTWVLRERGD